MSGHSHFSTIKRKKEITDKKRGKLFSKLAREISIAAKEKGENPSFNPKLKLAVEKARSANMPAENIEKAVKRATGEIESEKLEEFIFEAYGPEGIAIIVEGITDNKKRSLGEIKKILHQNGGKLVGEGAVKWMFEKKGCITVNLQNFSSSGEKETLELTAIEAGAEDIYRNENFLDIFTKIEDLDRVKKILEEKKIKTEASSLDWVAKEEVSLNEKNKDSCKKLFELLDENDSVQGVYSNLKM